MTRRTVCAACVPKRAALCPTISWPGWGLAAMPRTGAVLRLPDHGGHGRSQYWTAPAIPVASVATGFSGRALCPSICGWPKSATRSGRARRKSTLLLPARMCWAGIGRRFYDEIAAMKDACGPAHMKAILATGDLATLTNVYAASRIAMQAGADFIKTSTGKEGVNATLPVGLTMCRAIRDHRAATGHIVGFKNPRVA